MRARSSRARREHAFTEGISLAFIVAAFVMALAGYFFGRLMPNSLPSRIIPSAVEEKASLPLDAS